MLSLPIATSIVIAYVATAGVIPVIVRYATRYRLLDFPDGGRHRHPQPVPRLGGVAVAFGLLAAFVTAAVMTANARVSQLTVGTACAAAILFMIGLADDLRGVRPAVKLLAQTVAGAIVFQAGFRIEQLMLPPDTVLSLGVMSAPVTILWIVGLSNAFNLVDGLDGLAGGVGVIALLAAGAAALILGVPDIPWHSAVVAAALLGFLRHNAPPARIFLGDSGSLCIGFLLAVFTVRGATEVNAGLHVLAPIFALAYPLLDTGISMLRRWLRGHPLSRADGRHIHHQLCLLGLGPRRALAVIFGGSLGIATLGLFATFAPPALTLAVAIAGGAVLMFVLVYGARWLQYHELLELGASVASVTRHARRTVRDKIHARDLCHQIARAPSLEEVDRVLRDNAASFRFAHMQIGSAEEGFGLAPTQHLPAPLLWKLEYPVFGDNGVPARTDADALLVLNIWCAVHSPIRPASADRVAQVLGPAIASWYQHASSDARQDVNARVMTPAVPVTAIPIPAGVYRERRTADYGPPH